MRGLELRKLRFPPETMPSFAKRGFRKHVNVQKSHPSISEKIAAASDGEFLELHQKFPSVLLINYPRRFIEKETRRRAFPGIQGILKIPKAAKNSQ